MIIIWRANVILMAVIILNVLLLTMDNVMVIIDNAAIVDISFGHIGIGSTLIVVVLMEVIAGLIS